LEQLQTSLFTKFLEGEILVSMEKALGGALRDHGHDESHPVANTDSEIHIPYFFAHDTATA
jgi:hypothetical protein